MTKISIGDNQTQADKRKDESLCSKRKDWGKKLQKPLSIDH